MRAKNTLNTFMMCIAALAVVTISWALVGYSLAFGEGSGFIGNFDYAFLKDVGFEPFAEGQTIPHLRLLRLPGELLHHHHGAGLRRGGRADAVLAPTSSSSRSGRSLVYPVMAHWVFGGGFLFDGGTLDFAGGISVEMGSGFSALAAALVVGARKDYGRQALLPHNAVSSCSAPACCGSAGSASTAAAASAPANSSVLAFANTLLTPAVCLAVWFALDAIRGRKVTAIGAATAIIVGCVGITPGGRLRQPRLGDGARASS